MARRRRVIKKRETPDVKYKNIIINQCINYLMLDGQKATASKILYKSLELAAAKATSSKAGQVTEPLGIFLEAVESVRPLIEVKSRRVGGATYQVPVEVPYIRGKSLALRWIIESARKRSNKTMIERLSDEIYEATQGRGGAMKNKENGQKMAEANRAFGHLKF